MKLVSGCHTCFFLIGVLAVLQTHAQPVCKVEYYSTEQGLSHQAVTAMLKDREGFMWFGSWDGINRFDGHTFVSYKSSPGDSSQLGNDRIDQIVEDQSNHLWIQAYDRQVYRFDKRTERFQPLSPFISAGKKQKIATDRILGVTDSCVWLQSTGEGIFCIPQNHLESERIARYSRDQNAGHRLPSNTINFFHEDREHRIWIATPNGLCCLNRLATGIYKNNNIVPAGIAGGVNITAYDEDATRLYFSTATGSLIIFNKSSNSFSVINITINRINALVHSRTTGVVYATTSGGEIIIFNLDDRKITTIRYHTGEALATMYEDRTGCLWIEPQNLGVLRFEPGSRSFHLFSQRINDPNHTMGNRFKVFEDNNGVVWVNMKGGGFGYYNAVNHSIDYILNTAEETGYHLPAIVYNTYYDKAGILWLRIQGRELVKIIFMDNDFRQQSLVSHESGIGDNEIRGICYDRQNRLWLGAKSGKLYIRKNDQWINNLFVNEPPQGLGQVYYIMQDSHGAIWLATKKNGLFKAIPVNSEETRYRLMHFVRGGNSKGLTSDQIYAVLEDRQGRIWIGTFDSGLFLVEDDHDSIKFVHSGNAFRNYPKENFQKIRHMALDGAGNIWIGTTDGLLVLDANDRHAPVYTYTAYSKIAGDKKSLGNNDIQFIYRDAKNRMWLATSGGGLCRASGDQPLRSLTFRNYTTKDGLPNDYVLSCAEDEAGNLWIATENGLSRFNANNNVFRNYDSYDGLTRAGFSEASVCRRLPGEQLVFGTTKGYLTFDPGHINRNRVAANIAFTNLQINNEDAILKSNVNYIPELTLKYNQNIISIDYAILDHRAGDRQAFVVRLLGFDSVWHHDRQQRRAIYTNLPPGHYVFEVKNLSSDLYSNAPYRSLAITILPPPWKTGWAYLLYTVFVAVLLIFIRRISLAMIRLRHKVAVEQKLAALKVDFFTNISHELRTPLTLILNPLEQLAQKEKLSGEAAGWVNVASKNANRMLRFINQLLDFRKVESNKATLHLSRVEVVPFVKKIADHFTEAAERKGIILQINAVQETLTAWVDAEKLDVVIYNLLGNALKFSPEGKAVTVDIWPHAAAQTFSIAVGDQGPGVEPEKLNDIFELFYEGSQIAGAKSKGTGIGLALSKELVKLHGGDIRAANNEHGGLTVTVTLKMGLDRLQQSDQAFTDMSHTGMPVDIPVASPPLLAPAHNAQPGNPKAPLVLLVEDNDELRTFLRGQLSEFYRVAVACHGEEGWQKALQLMPDLILSDIMMPVMDGIQMLDKIRNDVSTSHIPVVLLSAKYSIESQLEGLKYGADYYITKPFHNQFLIAAIDNLLKQRKKLFESLVKKTAPVELGPSPIVVTSKDESFLKDVIRFVEEKMADPGFNIETVAENMNMSRTTFYKKFKSLTSLTPVEFVRDMRLQRARQYLDAGSDNISEVAYWVGFSNPKYFSTCFREKYQVSPSDYLKSK